MVPAMHRSQPKGTQRGDRCGVHRGPSIHSGPPVCSGLPCVYKQYIPAWITLLVHITCSLFLQIIVMLPKLILWRNNQQVMWNKGVFQANIVCKHKADHHKQVDPCEQNIGDSHLSIFSLQTENRKRTDVSQGAVTLLSQWVKACERSPTQP